MSYGMLYEDFGWWSWHSSALAGHKGNTPSSVTSGINYYLGLGVPASKLAVGTGFYIVEVNYFSILYLGLTDEFFLIFTKSDDGRTVDCFF